MDSMLHIAAQYLATAAKSFLIHKKDDSHTSLGFNTDGGYLSSHPFSENEDRLILDYPTFSLKWKSESENVILRLDGSTHKQVKEWLNIQSSQFLQKEYTYNLHYELPYDITDNFIFKLLNMTDLSDYMHLRILAQFSLEKIKKQYGWENDIRVWPHHFDTGLTANSKMEGITFSMGLAIPDEVCDDHYFYVSAYQGDDAVTTDSFPKLKQGEWVSKDFKGSILCDDALVESDVVSFFQNSIQTFEDQRSLQKV